MDIAGPGPDERANQLELLAAAQAGDRGAFDLLWRAYRNRIRAYVCRMTRDDDLAEDICQGVSQKLWHVLSHNQYQERNAFSPFVYRMARNRALDAIEGEALRRHEPLDTHEVPDRRKNAPDAAVAHTEAFRYLQKTLVQALLAEDDGPNREAWAALKVLAFTLYYADRKTLPEIREVLLPLAASLGLTTEASVGQDATSPAKSDKRAPTASQLNNWLRRGDILLALIRYLLREGEDLSGWAEEVIEDPGTGLSSLERKAARLRWVEFLDVPEVAEQTGLTDAEADALLADILPQLAKGMRPSMKHELHEIRKK